MISMLTPALALAYRIFDPSTMVELLGPMFVLAAVGVAAWAYARVNVSKAQEQAITTWRENAAASEAKAERYHVAYDEQRARKHEVISELAAEKMKTDQTLVLEELGQLHREFATSFSGILHELAAQRASGVSEITAELRSMEQRLVAVMEHQTAALNLIATKIVNGGPLHQSTAEQA